METKTFLTMLIIILLSTNVKSQDTLCSKVASQYRRVNDGIRSVGDAIITLKETKTDFIFQGWMRQNPCPDFCSDLPINQQADCNLAGYSFEHLTNTITQIKDSLPNIRFCGGFLAEFLHPESRNEMTGETFSRDTLWEMALDPSKWGIPKTKIEFQTEMAVVFGWTTLGDTSYHPKDDMHFFFPDITNPDLQELFLSWADKQIDCGVDALWIDALYGQAELLYDMTGDINHLSVNESYTASSYIIDEIHNYGLLNGKYIYIISWIRPFMQTAPYPLPNFDGLMLTIGTLEIQFLQMDTIKWNTCKSIISAAFGNIQIFARIDYGNVGSPLAVFSQQLSIDSANQFLKIADEYLTQKEITFIYPLHGGNMGSIDTPPTILSYGLYDWYDALAPEFQTYDTIKVLGITKSTLPWYCSPPIVLSVPIVSHNSNITVYPNPFRNSITFQIKDERISNYDLIIVDIFGKIVFTKTLNNKQETLNLNLPSGMYFYQVKDNKQFISSGKLIVQ